MKLKIFWLFGAISLFGFFGCNRSTPDSTKIRLELKTPSGEVSTASEPTTLADFDCYAVLLVNPSASLNSNSCLFTDGAVSTDLTLNYQQFIGGFYKDDSIEFEVANGRDRSIQLVGLKTNFGANTTQARSSCINIRNERLAQMSQIYLIGESGKFEVLPAKTTTVTVQNLFLNPNLYKLNSCTGNSKPSPKVTAGPPVLARLIMQDQLTNLGYGACIGGMVQLVDAAGNPADVTEDIAIQLQSAAGTNRFYRNYENCTGAGVSAQILNFFDGTNRFNHIPIFFKPLNATTTSINLVKQMGPATLNTVDTAITVTSYAIPLPGGNLPQLQIFDSFSNRSTVGADSLNPIVVKRGVCRTALVQLTGSSIPPQPFFLSGSGAPVVLITVIKDGSGDFLFYPNNSCTSVADLNSLSIALPVASNVPYIAEFSYVVPNGVDNNFRLQVAIALNSATYGPAISDLTSNNFFLIED